MRVLFDVNHPAHVHLFRNAIEALAADGHETVVTSREKDVTTALLDAYGIDHRPLSASGSGLTSLATEWTRRELRLLSVVRETEPDVIVSRLNPPAVHVGTVTRTPNIVVRDTKIRSPQLERLYHAITFPFIDTLCAPPDFSVPAGADHYPLDYQELAYLHPSRFDPDPEPLRTHGIDPDERYFLLRLSGVDAFHDVGFSGVSETGMRELLTYLDRRGTVYISSETALPEAYQQYELQFPPELMHHLLYYAALYVGDSGTMSTEAALLGTPAVRMNTMVGIDEEPIFRELEAAGLLYSFAEEDAAIEQVRSLVETADESQWEHRRDEFIADKPDVTAELLHVIQETVRPGQDWQPDEVGSQSRRPKRHSE